MAVAEVRSKYLSFVCFCSSAYPPYPIFGVFFCTSNIGSTHPCDGYIRSSDYLTHDVMTRVGARMALALLIVFLPIISQISASTPLTQARIVHDNTRYFIRQASNLYLIHAVLVRRLRACSLLAQRRRLSMSRRSPSFAITWEGYDLYLRA